MSVVATIAQVVAAVAAAIAAWAAVKTSGAAVRTAERADLTAERAAEALSRVTRPDLDVLLATRGDRVGTGPWPMDLVIRNDAPHTGTLLGVRVERTDGVLLREVTGCSVNLRGSMQVDYLGLGDVPAARSDPRPDEPFQNDEADIVCVVTFTDAAALARWRQRCYIRESVGWQESGGQHVPVYNYSGWGREEPERA